MLSFFKWLSICRATFHCSLSLFQTLIPVLFFCVFCYSSVSCVVHLCPVFFFCLVCHSSVSCLILLCPVSLFSVLCFLLILFYSFSPTLFVSVHCHFFLSLSRMHISNNPDKTSVIPEAEVNIYLDSIWLCTYLSDVKLNVEIRESQDNWRPYVEEIENCFTEGWW